MGQFVLNHAKDGGNYGLVYDSVHVLNALPSLDAEPAAGAGSLLAGWQFDDTPGTTPLVSYKSGGVTITPSTGTAPTLIAGGAEGAQVYTPTLVVCTPNAVSVAGTNSTTSALTTQDQFGSTGTLTPTTRTYSASGNNTAIATVSITGTTATITGVSPGTTTATITDTATGGGSATPGSIVITVTAGGTTYDWSSSATGVATTTTGAASEQVTDVSAGSATITITRHGTSVSCTVSVVCGGPGTGNEPSGMTPGVNTGDMTTAPSTLHNGTWTEGTAIVTTFQNNSSLATPEGSGGDPTKIQLCPTGPGSRSFTTRISTAATTT